MREFMLNGYTFEFDEDEAARLGAVPVDRKSETKEAQRPVNKARTPRNKSREF